MNKLFLLLIFVFFGLNSNAQNSTEEGYINDPDGYTNVRDGKSSSANIITRINTGELFKFQSSNQSNWWNITKIDGTIGYVHNSRIISVSIKADEIRGLFDDIRTTNPNNVEFGEVSNEQLFTLAERFPKSFVIAFNNLNKYGQQLVIEELEAPIHDGIDLKLVYQRIEGTKLNIDLISKILEAIKIAGNKIDLDVME